MNFIQRYFLFSFQEAENSLTSAEQHVVVEGIELEEGTVHYVIDGEDVTIENEMVTETF